MIIDDFLVPLEAANPSGIELRNDARFHAIERQLAQASRDARIKVIEGGGSGVVDLDWAAIIEDARELSASGRDLRLLVIVARAMTNDSGFDGLAAGLSLLSRTVTDYWDSVHPGLRESPSRREAAMRRINALYQIENTDDGLLGDLEFYKVLSPRGIGIITGGDLAAAALNRNSFLSEAPKGLGEKETAELLAKHEARVGRVTGVCRAMAAEQPTDLDTLLAGIASAQAAVTELETALDPHVFENDIGVKFGELTQFLNRVSQPLIAAKGETQPVSSAAVADSVAEASEPAPVSEQQAAPAKHVNGTAVPGQLTSRSDVERCLDLIIDFYARTEPSSPIPHLAQRMRKMVPMNFLQLMEEIAPGGIKEFRGLAGIPDEKAK
jgi:type VI secretion system protein ImpA